MLDDVLELVLHELIRRMRGSPGQQQRRRRIKCLLTVVTHFNFLCAKGLCVEGAVMVVLHGRLLLSIILVYFSQAVEPDVSVEPDSLLRSQKHKRAWPLLLLPTVQPAEAGIPGLHKWLLETFPSAAQRLDGRSTAIETDHLLFDLNQLLHQAAAAVKKTRRKDDLCPREDCSQTYEEGADCSSSSHEERSTDNNGDTTAGKRGTTATPDSVARRTISTASLTTAIREKDLEGDELQDRRTAEDEEEVVLRRFLRLLSATLRRVRPRRSVVFALDGVPPLAKFLTVTARHQRAVWQNGGGSLLAGTPETPLRASAIPAEEQRVNETPTISPIFEPKSFGACTSLAPSSYVRQPEVKTSQEGEVHRQVNECGHDSEGGHAAGATQQGREGMKRVAGSSNHNEGRSEEEKGTRHRETDSQAATWFCAGETGAEHGKLSQTGGQIHCQDAIPDVVARRTQKEAEYEGEDASTKAQHVPSHTERLSRYRIPPYVLIPGTRFMEKVEEACRRFARQRLSTRRDSNLRFFVSGSNSYGEGELKLLDWINAHRVDATKEECGQSRKKQSRDNATVVPQGNQMSPHVSFLEHQRGVVPQDGIPGKVSMPLSKRSRVANHRTFAVLDDNKSNSDTDETFPVALTDSIVIVGGDGDLVVQALAYPGVPDLFVYSPQRILSGPGGRCRVLYSLRALLQALERHFPGSSHLVRNDLAVLCILNGNDYLPKAGGFTFQHFFDAYTAARKRYGWPCVEKP